MAGLLGGCGNCDWTWILILLLIILLICLCGGGFV